MKFSSIITQIQNDWRFYYMDYDRLKLQLKRRHEQEENYTEFDENEFISAMEQEIVKVTNFKNMKGDELARRVIHYEKAFSSMDWNILSSAAIERLKGELERISNELCQLNKYSRVNHTGFLKIIRKHDKQTPFNIESTYKMKFSKEPIYYADIDDMIYRLSKLYSQIDGDNKNITVPKRDPPMKSQEFVRRTTKYWVHPDCITDVKVHILRNLPVLMYKDQYDSQDCIISSVYFDNKSLELYMGRLDKIEGAKAVRIRWYGVNNPKGVFIERKIHHEDWTGEKSYKSRFWLEESLVDDYISGALVFKDMVDKQGISDEDAETIKPLFKEIQEDILKKDLKPYIRTYYKRTAFQIPRDASVRISLDTDLCMITETSHVNQTNHWKRNDLSTYPFSSIPSSQIVRFPYAVLEVKLQGEVIDPPQWISDLVNGPLVEPVPKFSKFIHGMASIFHHVPKLPFWFNQMDIDIRKPLSPVSLMADIDHEDPMVLTGAKDGLNQILYEDSDDNLEELENRIHVDELENPDSKIGMNYHELKHNDGRRYCRVSTNLFKRIFKRSANKKEFKTDGKKIAIPVRVEPKVFFANERTFLSWLHFSIFLGGVASALVGLGQRHARISGYIFAIVSIMFAIYALHIYIWRANKIREKNPGPYDDLIGPVVLVCAFILAVVINLIIAITEG